MPSPEVLDFEKLLAPIPGDNPAGVYLREDYSPKSPYQAIKGARAAARAAERQLAYKDDSEGAEEPPDPRIHWRMIAEIVPQLLAEKSKDLEITAWYIEALVRLHGYAGLRDGFRLARELVERYWERLYPLPDEEGFVMRLAPLAGLNGEEAEGTLVRPILAVPITGDRGERPFSMADYRQACDVEGLGDLAKKEQRIAAGAVSMEMFHRAVAETPAASYRAWMEDLNRAAAEFQQLNTRLEEKCGSEAAPPSSNIRNALESCKDTIRSVAKHLLAEPAVPATTSAEANGGGALAPVDTQAGRWVGHVQTREDAFRLLLQVAEFFKRTEPHSPVSYALEQAVRWGRLPLPELLAELIPEEATRTSLYKLVGIRTPEQPQS